MSWKACGFQQEAQWEQKPKERKHDHLECEHIEFKMPEWYQEEILIRQLECESGYFSFLKGQS